MLTNKAKHAAEESSGEWKCVTFHTIRVACKAAPLTQLGSVLQLQCTAGGGKDKCCLTLKTNRPAILFLTPLINNSHC